MFTITIETDNDAFNNGVSELCRLLDEVKKRIKQGDSDGTLRDINGNTVGKFELKD